MKKQPNRAFNMKLRPAAPLATATLITNISANYRRIMLLGVILCATLLSTHAQGWVNLNAPETGIFDPPQPQPNPSLAVDHNNMLYAAYIDENVEVLVIQYNGTTWDTLGSAEFANVGLGLQGVNVSIAVAPDNTPYVAFIDNNDNVEVMKYNGVSWVYVGSSPGSTVYKVQLAIDGNGIPYIAYFDYGPTLNVMKYTNSSWQSISPTGIQTAFPSYPALAIDNNSGSCYVGFMDINGNNVVIKMDNGGSQYLYNGTQTLYGSYAHNIALSVDNSGNVYMAYSVSNNNSNMSIDSVQEYENGQWISLGSPGQGSQGDVSIANAPSGIPYIVFDSNNGISSAKYAGGSWIAVGQTIANPSGNDYDFIDIAIDSQGIPYTSFPNSDANISLEVYKYAGAITQPQGSLSAATPICAGTTGQLTFTATAGTGPFTIVYNDGVADSTANNVVSGVPFNTATNPTSTTTYTLISATDANSITTSSGFTVGTATITVNPILTPSISINTSQTTVCAGTNLTFSTQITNGGSSPAYAWYVNGNAISGATASSYAYAPANNDQITCQLTSNAACASPTTVASNSIAVSVNPVPSVPNAILNQTLCSGYQTAPVTFGGAGNGIAYTWTNSEPSIGAAPAASGNIASFTAVNTGNTPVTATFNVTPANIGNVYIPNTGSNTVSVLDGNTNALITNITVPAGPSGIAVSPDGSKVYVTEFGSNNLSVISTATNQVIANVAVGTGPIAVAASPDGNKIYTANYTSQDVTVVDASSYAVIATIANVGGQLQGLVVSPYSDTIYVVNQDPGYVAVINTGNNTIVNTIGAGVNPQAIAISPDGNNLYVSEWVNDFVLVINTATYSGSGVSSPSGGYGITISPDGGKVYVVNYGGTVTVLNTADNSTNTVNVGQGAVGASVSPDGSVVYVTNSGGNSVSVIDANSLSVSTLYGFSAPAALGSFTPIGCTGPSTSFTITVNPASYCAFTWTGTTSTDWNTASNWSTGTVPLATDSVIIPSSAPNQPVITQNDSVNSININSGATLTIAANGTLTVNGAITNAGTVTVQNLGGFLQSDTSTYTGSGTFNVQNTLTNSADGYRDLSSPVLGATVQQLDNSFAVSGQNAVDCWYSYTPYPNVQIYNEALNNVGTANGNYYAGWVSYTGLTNVLNPLQGVAARIDNNNNNNGLLITLTGAPNNGTESCVITNTPSNTTSDDGWNFVGNPYPSNIDWAKVYSLNSTHIAGSYYVFQTTGEYSGNWGACNSQGAATNILNGLNQYISPMQGFFVLDTTQGSATFKMDNTVRTTAASGGFYAHGPLANEVRLQLTDSINSDEILSYTDANATEGYDPALDAKKMAGGSTVYMSYNVEGIEYAINVMDDINGQTELPLVIEAADTGSYTLTAVALNVMGYNTYLKDTTGGQAVLTNLGTGNARLHLNGGQVYNNYAIVFSAVDTAISTGISTATANSTRIYGYNNTVYVKRTGTGNAAITITDLLGQQIAAKETGDALSTITLNQLATQYIIVKVAEGDKVTTAKIFITNNE